MSFRKLEKSLVLAIRNGKKNVMPSVLTRNNTTQYCPTSIASSTGFAKKLTNGGLLSFDLRGIFMCQEFLRTLG